MADGCEEPTPVPLFPSNGVGASTNDDKPTFSVNRLLLAHTADLGKCVLCAGLVPGALKQ